MGDPPAAPPRHRRRRLLAPRLLQGLARGLGPDEVYLKLSPTPEDYARAVHAYEHAARFAPHEVTRLLATDPGLRAIMTSPLSGLIVRGLCLTAEVESRVHELAGRLLRRWHDLPEPASGRAREVIMASVAEQAAEAVLVERGRTALTHLVGTCG